MSSTASLDANVVFENVELEVCKKYTVTAKEESNNIIAEIETDDTKPTQIISGEDLRTAFAVYSVADNSLNFYKRLEVPSVGQKFAGKIVTRVWSDVEQNVGQLWREYQDEIVTVEVIDRGIAPGYTENWFAFLSNCTSIDIKKLDTSKITNMNSMFCGCANLSNIDLTNFDTSKTGNMNSMFSNCTKLTSLDISSFDTAHTVYMHNMFDNCKRLKTIIVGDKFTVESAWSNCSMMFESCISLVGGAGSRFVDHGDGVQYAHIDGGESDPGYFTAKIE